MAEVRARLAQEDRLTRIQEGRQAAFIPELVQEPPETFTLRLQYLLSQPTWLE
jgi:hypothetical protein